jgi:hypothetical protein
MPAQAKNREDDDIERIRDLGPVGSDTTPTDRPVDDRIDVEPPDMRITQVTGGDR